MDMPGMIMLDVRDWSSIDVVLLFFMWVIMMIAMMIPSAAPMILTFLTVNARRQTVGRPTVPVALFVLGYLAVWTAYSAAATGAQWALHKAALLSTMMAATSPIFNGGLLIMAGLFQWTPLKRACLNGCRSPLSFLMSQWREGASGAFAMGLRHGSYCVGCCWILMALLFVTGVMNLICVLAISVLVAAEKLLRHGELFARVMGLGLTALGVTFIARSF